MGDAEAMVGCLPSSTSVDTTLNASSISTFPASARRYEESGRPMGIGKLRCHVIDVNDLEVAEKFWSEVTGLPVIPSIYPGRFSYLGQADPWRHEVILHLVRATKGPEANRSHVDIWVRNVDEAISQVEAIGGTLKRAPSIYPRPGSYPGEPASIDWSVMQDPFG